MLKTTQIAMDAGIAMTFHVPLSRRERQIMEILYHRGEATAHDVLAALPDPPSYSGIRTLLRVLEDKGHVAHRKRGKEYVYAPTEPRTTAARSALKHVLHTFFGGSLEQAMATLVRDRETEIGEEELARISALIEEAKEKGR